MTKLKELYKNIIKKDMAQKENLKLNYNIARGWRWAIEDMIKYKINNDIKGLEEIEPTLKKYHELLLKKYKEENIYDALEFVIKDTLKYKYNKGVNFYG